MQRNTIDISGWRIAGHFGRNRVLNKSEANRFKQVLVLYLAISLLVNHSHKHPPNPQFYRWYKPFPSGWFMALFYPHYWEYNSILSLYYLLYHVHYIIIIISLSLYHYHYYIIVINIFLFHIFWLLFSILQAKSAKSLASGVAVQSPRACTKVGPIDATRDAIHQMLQHANGLI